jgi:ankyrin repeat protein
MMQLLQAYDLVRRALSCFLQFRSLRPNTNFKKTLEGDSARALLDLDTHHRLFAGNAQRKLEVAVQLSHVDLIGNILKQRVKPRYLPRRELAIPLEQACQNGDFRLIKQLVEAGADLNPSLDNSCKQSKAEVLFQWALLQSNRGEGFILRYFLEMGTRPGPGGQTHTNNLQSYRILRKNNIETCFGPDWHDLMRAVIGGNEDNVIEYIAAGVNVNENLSLKIFGVFPRGNFESPVFQQLSFNCTVLQAAVENRHLCVVKILVKNNVDISAAIYSRHGWSTLETAHSLRQTDIIAELLQHGAIFQPYTSDRTHTR